MSTSRSSSFYIDNKDLYRITDELSASTNQVKGALNRALKRTETTLRKQFMSSTKRDVGLKVGKRLRGRVFSSIKDMDNRTRLKLWFGVNPIEAGGIRGKPRSIQGGAAVGKYSFDGAFVATMKSGHTSIFKRRGKERLRIDEQEVDIDKKANELIEDQLYDKVLDIFWKNFERDLKARIKYQIGAR